MKIPRPREAASLYGFSAEEAIGQPLRTLHAAELPEADYARLLERVRAGRPTTSGRASEPTLTPDECWALRLGRPHFVPRTGAIRCRHAHAEAESYVCMPIHGQGQILGLFHIAVDVNARTRRPARDTEHRLRAMADRVGPALANLKLRDALRELALRDGLTGLYNRRYMEDALNREIHRADRSGKPLSVVMIDIDHFKSFNDKTPTGLPRARNRRGSR